MRPGSHVSGFTISSMVFATIAVQKLPLRISPGRHGPWTDPDPQPRDFDAELALLDAGMVERHAGNPDARLRVLVSVEGEDAARLARIAEARG